MGHWTGEYRPPGTPPPFSYSAVVIVSVVVEYIRSVYHPEVYKILPYPNLLIGAALIATFLVEDLRAYGDSEIRESLASRDRDKHQFWQGWDAALQRVAALFSPVDRPQPVEIAAVDRPDPISVAVVRWARENDIHCTLGQLSALVALLSPVEGRPPVDEDTNNK